MTKQKKQETYIDTDTHLSTYSGYPQNCKTTESEVILYIHRTYGEREEREEDRERIHKNKEKIFLIF